MKYAGINYNDFSAAPGVSLTFYTQGCHARCKNCHNPETWDFDGGKLFNEEILKKINEKLCANGIQRNFCLMGGEPLCDENLEISNLLINNINKNFPNVKIYVWTGYLYEDLLKKGNPLILNILSKSDYLIDGLYIDELRDVTLKMRGSTNQRIINLKNQ